MFVENEEIISAHPFFMWEQCYVSLQDNTGMLSRCLWSDCLCRRRNLTFSSVQSGCLGFQHATVNLFLRHKPPLWFSAKLNGYSNNVLCLTLLYQEINERLPNPQGVHVFSSSCQEVERPEDDSSQLKGSDFRSIQTFRLTGEAKHI